MNPIKKLCTQEAGEPVVLQGNIGFAVGCVRSGIHAVDGYPGTPSTEVIDKGLSHVQDMITVGWSVNEAVAASVGHGHSLAGNDCIVTMKIPGLFQAGDTIGSSAFFNEKRGALVYYIASDFTPSSTQHLIDPRPFLKSCFIPILEPRNHQEVHEAAKIAADISRKYKTPVAILISGTLCHSEGLVRLANIESREKIKLEVPLKSFNTLPVSARKHYNKVVEERLPALMKMVEKSPLNKWEKSSKKTGIITYGATELFVQEIKKTLKKDIDILSIGFTWPVPMNLIQDFYNSISGKVYVIEDGYQYLQSELERNGMKVIGKNAASNITEWTPALVAKQLGLSLGNPVKSGVAPLMRPPMICAGCPYRLFGEIVKKMKKRGKIDACFGDIGCNTLLFFMDAVDTNVAMGSSEANRTGFVLSNPDKAAKCLSILGDGTECHSGLDSTRNTLFRKVPGVKVILDNSWTAMTGGQPNPASPVNFSGDKNTFDLQATLKAHGANVVEVSGYDKKSIEKALKKSLAMAADGGFTTLVITGTCIRKVPKSQYGTKMVVDTEKCKKCGLCLICPGIEGKKNEVPAFNNLCTGCVGQTAACSQMCPVGAIGVAKPEKAEKTGTFTELPEAPELITLPAMDIKFFPERISVAIRGVGGQGNLFFGRVLTQLAFIAGYGETNLVKGETHGMAQMGGPVISTFSCGDVCSPDLLPGTADCIVSMEQSEVLRDGFVDSLKPGGTVLLASTRILSYGVDMDAYPSIEKIRQTLSAYKVVEIDVLKTAFELGDPSGRIANVVMMGALSTLNPFRKFPEAVWFQALKNINPKPAVWTLNHAAFKAGRDLL